MEPDTRCQLAAALAELLKAVDDAGIVDQGGNPFDSNDALQHARKVAERFGFTADEVQMAVRATGSGDHDAIADWLCAHAGPRKAADEAAGAQLLVDGQEEVFSRAEVERGAIEHNTLEETATRPQPAHPARIEAGESSPSAR